ncbi:MAG: hypothetical protein FWD64_08985 [Acidobacteriaceae bacterium]|nr:hypothetical protein [Acidobacteriaceae bacterium]
MNRFITVVVCACFLALPASSQSKAKPAATKPPVAAKPAVSVANLVLNKEYSAQGVKFTVQSVKIYKDSYPMGMFSGRPSNPDMDPSYDGVLGIELTLTAGTGEAFSKLDTYLINEKGVRNVKEDQTGMSGEHSYTILFNVPMSARKLKLGIGSLKLSLEKVLNESE